MTSGIQFDPEAIRALAQILKDTDLSEIEVVEKDSRIRVARTLPAPALAAPYPWPFGAAMPAAPAAPVAAASAGAATSAAAGFAAPGSGDR